MTRWLLLAVAIISEVAGSLALKAAVTNPGWYALVVFGYVAAFVFIRRAMEAGLGLVVAYGVWGAMGVALTAVFGAALFGEVITDLMVVGLVLVVGGVLLVQLGSQRALTARADRQGAG